MMIEHRVYEMGDQPCGNFRPEDEYPGTGGNAHTCPACDGTVSFCLTCLRDHHAAGWETCARRISPAVARGRLRIELSLLIASLALLQDWSLRAVLPSVRLALLDTQKKIWEILELVGAPFANTNSNSKELRYPRITNSRSNEGENESTNTKYEEEAP